MNKIIGIVSGKGGAGKTTLCANIAFALAGIGKKVIAIDANVGLKNLDILLGMSDRTAFDLDDVLSGRAAADKAIQQHETYRNLYFISAPAVTVWDGSYLQKLCDLCRDLRREYEFVLVDAPAGIGDWVRSVIVGCDECIVVATPDLTSLRDAECVSQLIADCGNRHARLVINKINPTLINRGYLKNIDDMMDGVSLPLLGLVPTDDALVIYSNSGKPVVTTKSVCAGPFMNIAERLCGKNVPLDKYWKRKK